MIMSKISEKILLTPLYVLDILTQVFSPCSFNRMKFHNSTNSFQKGLKLLKLVLKIFSEYLMCSSQNQGELARVTSLFFL